MTPKQLRKLHKKGYVFRLATEEERLSGYCLIGEKEPRRKLFKPYSLSLDILVLVTALATMAATLSYVLVHPVNYFNANLLTFGDCALNAAAFIYFWDR